MVRKISGKYSNTKIRHLDVNGDEVTDIPDIANSLAQTFSQNCSSQQCSQKFDSYRCQAETNRLSCKSKNRMQRGGSLANTDKLEDSDVR